MSTKNTITKKAVRAIKRSKKAVIKDIAREIKTLPVWERIKFGLSIIFKGKI